MKKRIINLTIGLTGLIASFLPQKAEAAWCKADCDNGWCMVIGSVVKCYCDADGYAHCES